MPRVRIAALALAMVVVAPILPAQILDLYDPAAYRSIYLDFAQTNYWTLLTNNYTSQVEIPATMTVDGVVLQNVGVRFRGNTSYTQLPAGSQKKSFNIRTDSFVAGQDLWGYDHLNLNNGFHDPTFLREFLSYLVMGWYGPAPRCNFVKLYLNNVYWGVYINVQQPNKDWAGQWFRSNDGNRYRGFPTSGGFSNGRCALTWLGADPNLYLQAYQANQGDGVDLMNCCNILNNTPQAQLEASLPVIFSVDSFYRYAAVMNVLTNDDSYLGSGKDHYLYHDDVYGQFHMFPFDLNEALAGSTTYSMWQATTSTTRPCFSKTLPIPAWRARYIAHYRTIVEDTMSWAVLGPIATQFHSMIAADVAADTKKIYTTTAFTQNLTQSVTVSVGFGTQTIPGLQPLIQGRDTYLSALADLTPPRATLTQLQHSPANPTPAQSITITVNATSQATTVNLWRRSAGAFASTPMFDDGLHGDGAANDGTWGVVLPPQAPGTLMEYYVASATATGVLTFLPKTAEHNAAFFQVGWPIASSPIRINEFLASNSAVVQDPFGEYEDYVELYNTSGQTVDLSGWYLTDDLTNSTKWQFAAGQTIPANGTLLVWCDEDGIQGPLHASFKLSASGEAIALFAADGLTELDEVVFGTQATNISTGRFVDGGAPWVTFLAPTANASNALASCGVRRYSALDFASHDLGLAVSGTPQVGASPSLVLSGGPASGQGLLLLSPAAAALPVAGTAITALVDLPTALLIPVGLNASGGATLTFALPNDPLLAGARVYAQFAAANGATLRASNAAEIIICP